MINQKQLVIEWQKAGLKEDGFMFQNITDLFELAERNAPNSEEANKLVILAIRKAAQNNARTGMAVDNNLKKWLNAGADTAEKVGKYEQESADMRRPNNFGRPMKQEARPDEITDESIRQQNERFASQLGITVDEIPEFAAKKLAEIRTGREERLANGTGVTATGSRVLVRF